MKKSLILLSAAFFTLATTGFSQQANRWENWKWLMGVWIGEGSGQPGQGEGSFSFTTDLDGTILIRKNHSEFPAGNNRPAMIHDDLLIIYIESGNEPSKAIYFDNEGHVINYHVAYADKQIILTSVKSVNQPVFRLTYTFLGDDSVSTRFEISQDGMTFKTYLEGISRRAK